MRGCHLNGRLFVRALHRDDATVALANPKDSKVFNSNLRFGRPVVLA